VTQHLYAPRGSCVELFEARDPEVLLSGPAGTGKSRACLEKVLLCAVKYPGMRGIIIRKTLTSLGSTALATWRKFVIPELLASGAVRFYGGSKEQPAQYRLWNGSTIMLCGMDKATRIMSSEYDLAYVQEAIELSLTDWENINTRLRNGVMPYQQLLADTNPDTPTHWLKKRCDDGATRMVHCLHEDNPILFTDGRALTERGRAYIGRLDALTGVRKQRLRNGSWVAAEGMIYENEWREDRNLTDRAWVPREYARYWSVDFGYIHPFVLQQWAMYPDGILVLYREIYMTRRTVDVHAADLLKVLVRDGTWREPRPTAVVCDHDAEGRAQLERALGMGTVPAMKRVTEGIQAVQARMGEGRLKLMRGTVVEIDEERRQAGQTTSTLDEVPGYVWDLGGGKTAREAPVKVDDDGMDAMRYMIAYHDLRSRPRVRWM
jgi:phage terminase large subunit